MKNIRLSTLGIIILGLCTGYFLYAPAGTVTKFPFKLGLDLKGGTHLVYSADVSNLQGTDVNDSLAALRETIERRVNVFGVAEPLVQLEKGSAVGGSPDRRLIVEMPGVTDTQKAIEMIGKTPVLDFRLMGTTVTKETKTAEVAFVPTQLTGRFLSRASVTFGSQSNLNTPTVSLKFNSEGAALFEKITREHKGEVLGIFLDGQPISTPVIQDAISGGEAVITGTFTPNEARELVRNLNLGALPVPITLISSETIGSTLGAGAVQKGITASVWAFVLVALFFLLWYRLPGVMAVLALGLYVAIILALFKLIPITVTAAGIAGLILSMGIAVDANILIFERMKEELRAGRNTVDAIKEGSARAWGAIRDGHVTSIIAAIILFWFGTSIVKGFALVFGLGVVLSLFTAITVTRTLLLLLGDHRYEGWARILYGSGVTK